MPLRRRSIIAHHLILPLYGHWAPNDPRGSGSTILYNDRFEVLGPIHFGRKPAHEQPSRDALREFHKKFKALLTHPVFWIDDAKRQAISQALADVVRHHGYTVYACAICANHVHLIVRIHRDNALTLWRTFADATRAQLCEDARFPEITADHPVWAERPYTVYLYDPDDVRRTMKYIEQNPLKERLTPQKWPFITPYNNWPLHKHARTP